MTPHARDRARDKRRNEKRQNVLAERAMESRRNKQVLGIVLAIVVVLGGFVGLTFALNRDKQASSNAQPNAQASAAPSVQSSSAPPVSANPVAGCVTPPKVPTDKRTRTLPDKKTASGKTFIATVTTNCGVITLELDGTKAPQTVASFV